MNMTDNKSTERKPPTPRKKSMGKTTFNLHNGMSMKSLDKADDIDKTKSVGFTDLTGPQIDALRESYAQF